MDWSAQDETGGEDEILNVNSWGAVYDEMYKETDNSVSTEDLGLERAARKSQWHAKTSPQSRFRASCKWKVHTWTLVGWLANLTSRFRLDKR